MTAAVTGLLAGLSLIVAIGAQNAWVLRQGVRRDRVGVVVAICALSDAVLIVAGTAGVGALVTAHPEALTLARWAGAAYLVWFAVRSLRAARSPQALHEGGRATAGVVATTLALTWLNPHVYLDTVVMLGTLAAQHGSARWLFAGGAVTASVLWFTALGFGARLLARPLSRPRTWQVLDATIGVLMLALAVRLLVA